MRAISKTITYATVYRDWEITLGTEVHPKYVAGGYYKDILVELLILQGGICAYTEMRIVDENDIETYKNDYLSGRFTGVFERYPVDLEHFDSRLKPNYGWRWSNFFAVFSNNNQKEKRIEEAKLIKAGKSVHNIMKPDLAVYDPFRLLDYEPISNMIIPNLGLTAAEKVEVNEMIICLGLNNGFIKRARKEYYAFLKFEESTGNIIEPNQFYTGWEIMRRQVA